MNDVNIIQTKLSYVTFEDNSKSPELHPKTLLLIEKDGIRIQHEKSMPLLNSQLSQPISA